MTTTQTDLAAHMHNMIAAAGLLDMADHLELLAREEREDAPDPAFAGMFLDEVWFWLDEADECEREMIAAMNEIPYRWM